MTGCGCGCVWVVVFLDMRVIICVHLLLTFISRCINTDLFSDLFLFLYSFSPLSLLPSFYSLAFPPSIPPSTPQNKTHHTHTPHTHTPHTRNTHTHHTHAIHTPYTHTAHRTDHCCRPLCSRILLQRRCGVSVTAGQHGHRRVLYTRPLLYKR